MHRLICYGEVIYDTQCIIFQCFRIAAEGNNGKFDIEDRLFTEPAKKLTTYLLSNSKIIKTIRLAIKEIKDELIVKVVKKKICEIETRRNYGLKEMEKFPEDEELRITKRLREKIDKFSKKLYVEEFTPNKENIRALGIFYEKDVQNNPQLKAKYNPNKRVSWVDKDLVIYSKETKSPLVTNDEGIFAFKEELEKRGLCFKIYALMELN